MSHEGSRRHARATASHPSRAPTCTAWRGRPPASTVAVRAAHAVGSSMPSTSTTTTTGTARSIPAGAGSRTARPTAR